MAFHGPRIRRNATQKLMPASTMPANSIAALSVRLDVLLDASSLASSFDALPISLARWRIELTAVVARATYSPPLSLYSPVLPAANTASRTSPYLPKYSLSTAAIAATIFVGGLARRRTGTMFRQA